jgi:hypothetical protein
MKKLITILILCITSSTIAQIPSFVPSTGLVGWWPFNGNANDESGNGNNGTVNGATLTTDRFGMVNKAYSFDGVNDLILINAQSTIPQTSDYSVSFWFYSPTSNFNGAFLSFQSWFCKLGHDYPGLFYKDEIGNQSNTWYIQQHFSTEPSINSWHFLVITKTGNNVSLHLDNQLVGSTVTYGFSNFSPSSLIQLGFYCCGMYYNGKLDDFALWNRTLTPTEITNLYNSINTPAPTVSVSPASTTICPGTPTTLTASTSGSTACSSSGLPTSLQTGLVGYWPFCGNANDASGNGYNGTVNGATLTTDRFGVSNSAYFFDHSNEIVTNCTAISNDAPRTISFWMKNQYGNKTISPIWYGGNPNTPIIGSGFNIIFNRNEQSDQCGCWPGTYEGIGVTTDWIYVLKQAVVGDNLWHNWVVVVENIGSNFNQINYYKDGVLITSNQIFNYNNNGSTPINTLNQSPLKFGKSTGTSSNPDKAPTQYLDDIAIWNRALTASEIQQLYSTSNATYSWSPGGATTPSITVSPNATTTYTVTATANGQSSTSTAVVTVTTPPTITASSSSICAGQSATLTAVGVTPNSSSCIGNLGSPNPLPWPTAANGGYIPLGVFGPQSVFSISMWVKPGQTQNGISVILDASHGLGINWVIQTLNSGSTWTWGLGEFVLSSNAWQHLLLTYNNGARKVFVNGIEVQSWTELIPYSGNPSLYLGNWPEGGRRFNGLIDELYITTDVIATANFTPQNTVQTTSLSTFGLWHFDEGTGISTNNIANTNFPLNNWYWDSRALSSGSSISWSPSGATTPSINVSPTSTTTYTCSVTTNGTTCSSNQVITVNAIPAVNAGLDQSVCTGSNVTLSATGATTYAWSGGVQNGVAFAPTSSGTYTVTGTSNGCSATDAVQVTLLPAAVLNSNPAAICAGQSTTLTAAGVPPNSSSCIGNLGSPNPWPWPTAANGGYIPLGVFGPQSVFSISMWIRPGQTQNGISIILDASHGGGSNWVIQTLNSGSTWTWGTGEFALSSNAWQHLLLTYNNGARKVFVNGIEVQSWSELISYSGNPSLYLGNWPEGGRRFKGLIDELYITTDVIATANFTPQNIVQTTSLSTFGLWHFDEGTGISTNNIANTNFPLNNWYWDSRAIASGSSISWSPGGATTPSITVSPSSTTTYTCSVTTNGSTCSSNQVITVNAIPMVNAGLDQSVCTGSNVTLSATGATTYAWSGGVQNGVAFAPTSSGTYTVTGTSNGCSATDAVQVTVNPLPTANAGADFTKTCVTNPSGTLVGMSSVAGNTYAWTPATGLSSAGAANPTANPTATTTYTLTATNTASGCTATDQVLVTVNTALPTANAGADFTKTCVTNPSGTLVGMTSVAGNTYAWTPATGLSSAGAANPTANPTATTTYTLTATNTASGCTATDQVLVTVNTALPTVNAGLDQTLCQGVSTVLNASSNGATLSWNNGAQNNISFVPSAVGTTTYTATATGSNGCTANDNMVVTVNPLPSAAVTTNGSSSFCPGSSVQLCAPTGTGYSYLWSGNLGTTQCVTISSSATTSVTVTNAFNCSATSAPQQVTVFNNPLASAGLDATITCVQNASGAQIGAVPNPTYTYSWTPASGLSSATIGNPIANPSTTTTYTLTVVNADGCMGSDQVTVTVNNTPPTANAGLDQSICLGASLALQGSTNGASGTWNNGVTNGIPFTPSQTGTAAYTYSTVGANGCVNNDQVSVTVNALPVANAGQGGIITCVQNVNGIQLGVGPSSGNTYAWTPSSGLNNSNTSNPTAIPTASTTYTLLMSDANGCSDTAQVVVTVNNNPPIVSAGNDANVCNGDSLYLFANTTAGSTVVWNGTIQNGSNVLPTQSGYQVATATAANGCTSQDSLMATILQPTTSTLNEVACDEFVLNGNIYLQTGTYTQLLTNTAGCDSTITLNLTINLSPATPVVYVQNEVNLSTDVVPGQTYQWIYCSDLVNVPGATNPTFNPTANAIYAVVATNNCGSDTSSCTTVSTIGLADNEQPEIEIYPNPNNGHFTILFPKNNGSAKLEVLDLNGRIIFESTLDQQSNELHLETLSSGTYWLRINQQIPVPVTKY